MGIRELHRHNPRSPSAVFSLARLAASLLGSLRRCSRGCGWVFLIGPAMLLLLVSGRALAASPVAEAVRQFEMGEYQMVVELLDRAIEGETVKDPVEKAQALRIYGIACVLTGRRWAAESAFLHWLRLDPGAHLDPALVRPEAVEFFQEVRARHRQELLGEIERRRPRTAVLNLIPPAGQFQNGQRVKFALLLGAEAGLLAINLATGLTLRSQQHQDGTFPDPAAAERLRVVNIVSFATLGAVLIYGVVDGFYYYRRIHRKLEHDRRSLRIGTLEWAPGGTGWALRF